jgi:hypothetical protein
MSPRQQNKKKRDLTFPIILCLLLLFPLAVDHMFDQLKIFLDASGIGRGSSAGITGPIGGQGGHGGSSGLGGQGGGAAHGALSGHGRGAIPGSFTGRESGGRSSLDALAKIERDHIERYQRMLEGKATRSKSSEGWAYVEPMPSRPSRFFPGLPKPTLSSGVALSTGPDSPREPERIGENVFGKASPVTEAVRENTWGKGNPVAETTRANTWGKGTPVAESRSSNWGSGNPAPEVPRFNPPPGPPVWPSPPAEPEPPRLQFKAQIPPKARPTEQAKNERLMDVCGRRVPISQAATAALDCAPKPAPEPERKPASQELGEDGPDPIFLP